MLVCAARSPMQQAATMARGWPADAQESVRPADGLYIDSPLPRKVWMRKRLIALVTWMDSKDPAGRVRMCLSALFFLPAVLMPFQGNHWSHAVILCIGILLILAGYISFGLVSHRHLRYTREELVFTPLIFVTTTVLLILVFSAYYAKLPLVAFSKDDRPLDGLSEAFYFSTATFTTLGFGDIVPISVLGRWIVVFESLLGMTHMVVFILLFLRNVDFDRPAQEGDEAGRDAGVPAGD
ncbi:potassium channel family protein [Stenotrophomonas sp. NPDC077659]|uniref:potassium channel family protein n=1 Tax=Stenotrophomonas sp. NPDC077659 TaxID=3390694 RepID=UPI003D052585